jgi:hypothetical protein
MEKAVLNYFVILVSISIAAQLSESSPVVSDKRSKRNYKIVQEDVKEPVSCDEVPDNMLNNILGPAFNRRYMSLEPPRPEEDFSNQNGKRGTENVPPFYVDDTFALELSNLPAWEVSSHAIQRNPDLPANLVESENGTIVKRDLNGMAPKYKRGRNAAQKRPWECEARIHWIDLGRDYYPRYLRTVECTKHLCWYGHYTCQPRSFTVKLLRRRRGECVPTKNKIGISGMPGDLRELWIWEERAVNFCCDCAAPK